MNNVLVTSSSGKIPLISAVLSALERVDSQGSLIVGDANGAALSSQIGLDFWAMPLAEKGNLELIIAGCQERGIGVIIPTRDGELMFWSEHKSELSEHGLSVIVSDPEALVRCLDKLLFASFLRERGFNAIPTSLDPHSLGTSFLVVKERYGSGSRGVHLKLSPEEARSISSDMTEPIFQPFVEGTEISADVWVSREGKVPGAVLRRRDLVIDGESRVTTTFSDPMLEKEVVKVVSSLGLRGPVVLQGILTNDGLSIIEVNARFGGASTAGIAVGLDGFYWSLSEVLAGQSKFSFKRLREEARQVRVPCDSIAYGSDF